MKRLRHILYGLTLLATPLCAEFEDSLGPVEPIDPEEIAHCGPWEAAANYDYIGDSKFRKDGFKQDSIRFSQTNAKGGFIFYHNPCYNEGALLEIGYSRTEIVWQNNPFFSEKRFNGIDTVLGFFTERACGWLWQAKVGLNVSLDHSGFTEYSTYDFLVWGRYQYRENIGVHAGFLAETGLRIDHVYPIFGFDWQINECTKLNAVFPLNISYVYDFACNWSCDLAVRFFNSRHRFGDGGSIPHGLLYYYNYGGEVALNYHRTCLKANIHGGYTTGGEIKVADKQYRNKQHFKFKPAGYVGAEVSASF